MYIVKEFDRDYRVITRILKLTDREFEKRNASGEFNNWTGYEYIIKHKKDA